MNLLSWLNSSLQPLAGRARPPKRVSVVRQMRRRVAAVSTTLVLLNLLGGAQPVAARGVACALITPGEVLTVAGVDPNKTTEHGTQAPENCFWLDNAPAGEPPGSLLTYSLTLSVPDSSQPDWANVMALNTYQLTAGSPAASTEIAGLGQGALWRSDHTGSSTAEYDLRVFSGDTVIALAVSTNMYADDAAALGALSSEARAILSRLGGAAGPGASPPIINTGAGAANPARSTPPVNSPPVAATPVVAPPADDVSNDSKAACNLLTTADVSTAMKQPVSSDPGDPYGIPGGAGCEFDGPAGGYAKLVLIHSIDASVVAGIYDGFRTNAEPNGVQNVPGLGDNAFTYVGDNGPGVVVASHGNILILEFNGIGSGPAETTSLLALAQQAVGRIH